MRAASPRNVRAGVTLIEVLTAMFIMAIGMLALLTLFPLGAISMGQALRDDRAATAGAMAANMAIAMDLRHDLNIIGPPLQQPTPLNPAVGSNWFVGVTGQPWAPLPANYFGPSYPVFVDPYGVQSGLGPLGAGNGSPGIYRASPSYVGGTLGTTDPWFTFLGDITFTKAGMPDTSAVGNGGVERAGNTSWAYLMRRRNTWEDNNVDLSVVVYSKRTVGALTQEPIAQGQGTAGQTSIIFNGLFDVRRGGWILDVTYAPFPNNPNPPYTSSMAPVPVVQGYFYQVINVTDVGGSTTIDVQPALKASVSDMVIMNDVHSVLERGVSWQP